MTHRVSVYPHNDLFNLAHYHREVVNTKTLSGGQDSIFLDCMSCLIALAFSTEALINFIGHMRVKGWRERQSYRKKINQVCGAASLDFNLKKEPFSTLWTLKELRDSIAHGQPIEVNTTACSRDELRTSMACPWDQHLTPEYVNHAYEQAKFFERALFVNCCISVGETITSAVGVGE